jgi:hypothetical protein
MSDDRKERARHPSTAIPASVIEEISYYVYLLRLEPPMTPEESAVTVYERDGKIISSGETRLRNSRSMEPLTRAYLRVLFDIGMLK